ncbi:MAG: HPr family phosphocarrier protein [Planctomycetota bacterium]|nr:HPr family phosphocarrier protein [Planctomycetota bacterium]NRA74462.1 HPr family phosphocarrier protein [Planctomycetota bacterium]
MSESRQTVKITYESGLHARASTEFVRLAQRFDSEVKVGRSGGNGVDGKSIIAVMTLGAQLGDEIEIQTVGSDAEDALEALIQLVRHDFHGV